MHSFFLFRPFLRPPKYIIMGTISCQHLFYNFLRFFLQNTKKPVKTGLFRQKLFHFTRLTDEKMPSLEHNHQCRQQIRRPHLFDFCNIQPQNKCHQATYGNKILYGSGIKIGHHPFFRVKTQGQYQKLWQYNQIHAESQCHSKYGRRENIHNRLSRRNPAY